VVRACRPPPLWRKAFVEPCLPSTEGPRPRQQNTVRRRRQSLQRRLPRMLVTADDLRPRLSSRFLEGPHVDFFGYAPRISLLVFERLQPPGIGKVLAHYPVRGCMDPPVRWFHSPGDYTALDFPPPSRQDHSEKILRSRRGLHHECCAGNERPFWGSCTAAVAVRRTAGEGRLSKPMFSEAR